MAEKTFVEDDLKGLEKEIEAAVDRLFVEKGAKPSFTQPAAFEPDRPDMFIGKEKEVEKETIPAVAPKVPQPTQILEELETQLFSLEWEITQTNLEKTMEQVLQLKEEFNDSPEVPSVLQRMARVLTFMIQNQEKIKPNLLQFLFDSKETLKLLMRKDAVSDLDVYKKLALTGLEARFSCLEEFQNTQTVHTSVQVEVPQKIPEVSNSSLLYESLLQRMEIFSNKLDQLIDKMDHHLSTHATISERPIVPSPERSSLRTKVTLFKIGERLFGVESDRVEKLFKVPKMLSKKIVQQKRLRLKELDIRMVDLENIFSIPLEEEGEEEKQVLVLKVNGEYKGVLMDGVLNRLSGPLEEVGEFNEYIQGMMRWTYQDLPIKVPILNLTKL